MRATGSRWRRALALALSVLGVAGLVACVDLFHSTDFGGGCALEAGSCADASSGVDATKGRDSGRDAGRDGRVEKGDARDATVAPPSEGGKEAGFDAGTNFCAWSEATAAAKAQQACLWLGACAGTEGLNEYGQCYPNALLAYDCALNPNQQVRGTLHAYWDGLWQAKSCADVIRAVFPAGNPCSSVSNGCVNGKVVTSCNDGGVSAATNCEAVGYGCSGGGCALEGADSCGATVDASIAASCVGSILHSCQRVGADGGAVVDVGRDCASFGAGKCVAGDGAVGCAPDDALTACDASTLVTCAGDATATGCATGFEETVNCGRFGHEAVCGLDGGHVASSRKLAAACYNLESPTGALPCSGDAINDYAGPSGVVVVACPSDAGCNTASGSQACNLH